MIDGIGDQVTSAFSTNTFNKNGSNVPELGYASYVSPHRILLNVGYRLAHKSGASNFGLYYEAFRQGYIGSYSYSRYSYTMYVQSGKYQNPVTNDRGAVNLIYIPTSRRSACRNGKSRFPLSRRGMCMNSWEKTAVWERLYSRGHWQSWWRAAQRSWLRRRAAR